MVIGLRADVMTLGAQPRRQRGADEWLAIGDEQPQSAVAGLAAHTLSIPVHYARSP